MQNNVVAHFTDGHIVKGTSLDAQPGKPTFHIRTPAGETVEVRYGDLKALYFVRKLEGNPGYRESAEPHEGDARLRGSKQVRIKFRDGEEMVGLTNAYPPTRALFFALPIDASSNNMRILVNRDSIASMSPHGG